MKAYIYLFSALYRVIIALNWVASSKGFFYYHFYEIFGVVLTAHHRPNIEKQI
jgi:hypothetical protein